MINIHTRRTAMFSRFARLLGLTLLMLPVTVPAQQTLEEIIVRATRRGETDLQRTPIAVTALNEDAIQRLMARDIGDLAVRVPNFSAGKPAGFNAAAFAIRGVGQTSIIVYLDPQVGVMVDDFVVPHIQTQLLEMIDIESVEVLRGPQGTLFGKNTTGGLVNVRTKRPDYEQASLELQGRIADFGRREGQIAFNLPFADNFAFRAAGLYMKSDGYWENGSSYGPVTSLPLAMGHPADGTTGQGDGSDLGGDDVFSGRFKLGWRPTENLDLMLSYEIVRDEGDTVPSANNTPPGVPEWIFNQLGLTRDPGDGVDRGAATNRNGLLLEMGGGNDIDVDGLYLNLDWDIGNYTISGIAGRRDEEASLPSTYTGEVGPNSVFDATRDSDRETTQLEARIASNFDGPFNFVAGAFYQEDETDFAVNQVLGIADLRGFGTLLFGDPTFYDNNPQVLSNAQEMEAWALFGDITYEINDQWTLSAGARYTDEQKDWTGRHQVFYQALQSSSDPGGCDPLFFGGPTYQEVGEPLAATFGPWDCGVVSDSESWDEPTWRVVLSYDVSENVYTYFNYARGFKSGGYNDQTGTTGFPLALTPELIPPVDPETADSFELGIRSDLLDDTLRLNGTVFYVTYDDAQQQLVTIVDSPAGTFEETRFFNAAEITAWGLELEGAWLVTDNFRIEGNLGYLNADYDEFAVDTDVDGTIDVDFSGEDVTRSPEWMGGIDFLYDHPVGPGTVTWDLGIFYEDESIFVYTEVPNTPHGKSDDRTLVNLSATYESPDGNWFVRAYGKNLTDEEYRIGELPVADLWVMAYYGEPRSWGIEGGIKFDW